jgi:hypothetical protein
MQKWNVRRFALWVTLVSAAVPAVFVAGCKKTDDAPPPMEAGGSTGDLGAAGAPGATPGATATMAAGGTAAYPIPTINLTAGAGGMPQIVVQQGPPGTPTTFVLPQGSVTVVPGTSSSPPTIQLPPGLTIPTSIPLPGFTAPPPATVKK